jgi:hypothetical protein
LMLWAAGDAVSDARFFTRQDLITAADARGNKQQEFRPESGVCGRRRQWLP